MSARNDEPNHIASNGELRLQRLVYAHARPDSRLVVFDVGARIGEWSRGIVDIVPVRGKGFEIHAFEPVPDSRTKIVETFSGQIGRGDLRVNPVALSNTEGTFPMYVPHYTAGTSTLHPDSTVTYEKVLQVTASTVELYCAANSINYIDLLKIDTEGNDLRVIQGAMELLKNGKIGVLQFEYNHRWIYSRTYLKDVFDLMQGLPYRIAKVVSNALEVYVEWNPELERFFETNFALVHQDLVEALGCQLLRIGHGNACEEAWQ